MNVDNLREAIKLLREEHKRVSRAIEALEELAGKQPVRPNPVEKES